MILLDLNVLLDVLQARQPFYPASAAVVDKAISGSVAACVPAHALTTVHYLVARYNTPSAADSAVDWLLEHFSIAGVARDELLRARTLGWGDFEDAVVAAAAESSVCEFIITRNISDFARSPVPALTPDEYLASLEP